jgi:hypothetical protein
MGIDAQIETVEDGNPTGKLIAVQIKTGASHFKVNRETYTHYIDPIHYQYWNNHSLPVVLVGVLSKTDLIWQKLDKPRMERTTKRYKTLIPKSQAFDRSAKEALEKYAEGPTEIQRFKKLMIDRPMINYLNRGGNLYVEFEDWVNKLVNRPTISVYFENERKYTWHYWYSGGILTLIEEMFPWASIRIDEEYYAAKCDYTEEELSLVKARHGHVYPFNDEMGEVENYRVRLSLNAFGKYGGPLNLDSASWLLSNIRGVNNGREASSA